MLIDCILMLLKLTFLVGLIDQIGLFKQISDAVNEVLITKREKVLAGTAAVRHKSRIADTSADRPTQIVR